MSQLPSPTPSLYSHQQAIRAACVHPSGTFIEFATEEQLRSRSQPAFSNRWLAFQGA